MTVCVTVRGWKCNAMSIGKRIEYLRGRDSRKAFAERIGIVETTLRNYEIAQSLPNSDVIANICRACGVSYEWLITGAGPMRDGEITAPPPQAAEAVSSCARCIKLEKELELERENSRQKDAIVLEAFKKDVLLMEAFKKIDENGDLRLENLKLQHSLDTARQMCNEFYGLIKKHKIPYPLFTEAELKRRLSLSADEAGKSAPDGTDEARPLQK